MIIEHECPFCGDSENLEPFENDLTGEWQVLCNSCEAQGPVADSETMAVRAWDNRE